jgi:hypothetical protein
MMVHLLKQRNHRASVSHGGKKRRKYEEDMSGLETMDTGQDIKHSCLGVINSNLTRQELNKVLLRNPW